MSRHNQQFRYDPFQDTVCDSDALGARTNMIYDAARTAEEIATDYRPTPRSASEEANAYSYSDYRMEAVGQVHDLAYTCLAVDTLLTADSFDNYCGGSWHAYFSGKAQEKPAK
jgi:hypothetical protein